MAACVKAWWIALAAAVACADGKVFSRCELVRELSLPRHRVPRDQLATWVCVAWHESRLNTSAVGNLNADGSGDHGLFQISDAYWCSPPGRGQACGIACDRLEDDDIADDVVCARRVHRATRRRTGDGFDAWAVYPRCRDPAAFADGCDEDEPESYSASSSSAGTSETTTEVASSTSGDTTVSSSTETTSTSESTDLGSSTPAEEGDDDESSRSLDRRRRPFVGHDLVSAGDRDAIAAFLGRPPFGARGRADSGPGPLAAWLRIHNDPRFLDRPSP